MKEFTFPNEASYIAAWSHLRGLNYTFSYHREDMTIWIDPEQEGADFMEQALLELDKLSTRGV